MTPQRQTSPVPAPSAGFLWFALALLVISVCINYLDRGNLPVAKSLIAKELTLDPEQMGRLLGAFSITYSISLVFAGWFIDRFNVNWLYATGYLLWSGATMLTGYAEGFAMLFGLRLILGVSESIAYPCYSKIIASSFQENQRGVANSLIDAGSKLGPALGIYVCAKLMDNYGWRMMFILIGGVSLLWLLPWLYVCITHKIEKPSVQSRKSTVSVMQIVTHRSAIGSSIGLFGLNYMWYFLLNWLPGYLVDARGYSTAEMAKFGPLPFYSVAFSSALWGWVSDQLIRRGHSPTKVRKGFFATGLIVAAAFLVPSAYVPSPETSLWLQVISAFWFGMATSNLWAITQSIAGPDAAATWTGIQNAVGNLAGFAGAWLTGWLVKVTGGSFLSAFGLAGGMALMAAAMYLFVVGDVKPIDWEKDAARQRS